MADHHHQQQQRRRDITIVGGGIIGCCTAYYLTRHPAYSPHTHRITLLEAASTSAGGRTRDSIADPATLLPDPAAAAAKNPAHDGIAGGASGKAGGLLALWAFPANLVPLSFRLHDELAREHNGAARWGYRRCHASQVELRARLPAGLLDDDGDTAPQPVSTTTTSSSGLHKDHRRKRDALRTAGGAPADLDWLDDALRAHDGVGTPADTAQVHPELFTRAMAQLAADKGVRIVTGARVTAINKNSDGDSDSDSVESVTYVTTADNDDSETQHLLPTSDCVVAAGPWTPRLLPRVPVSAARAHSIVVRPRAPVSAYALFTSIALPAGFPTASSSAASSSSPTTVEPEIYARPDGTAYACGPTDTAAPLPRTSSADVAVDRARCDDLAAQVAAVSGALGRDGGAEVLARQACYLPQGGPWIGEVGTRGLVVAAGHSCWGIQNAPATGMLVSEILLDGAAKSAELGACDAALVL